MCHRLVIKRQTVTELFDSLLTGPVLHTFTQYSIAFYSRLAGANDVISSRFVMLIVPDKTVKFRDLGSSRSQEII